MSGFIPAALKIEVQTYLFSGHLFQIDDKFCQNQFSHWPTHHAQCNLKKAFLSTM